MKRFWLFMFDNYYPTGGMNDFVDSFETKADAVQAVASKSRDYYQILDSRTGEIENHPSPSNPYQTNRTYEILRRG